MLDSLKAFDRMDWNFIFFALQKFRYGNKFMHLIEVAYSNVQSRIKMNGLIAAKVLADSIIVGTRIIGLQIGDHEIKIVNFANDTTIFLRDIHCPNRIQKTSSSKINFSANQALWTGENKNRLNQPGNMEMATSLHKNPWYYIWHFHS